MFFNENAVKNKIQTYKNRIWEFFDHLSTHESKDDDEMRLDREIEESFPASDSPAHRSKSSEDRVIRH